MIYSPLINSGGFHDTIIELEEHISIVIFLAALGTVIFLLFRGIPPNTTIISSRLLLSLPIPIHIPPISFPIPIHIIA